ncbi:hypothetical protein [Pectobacterium aroidearum]|nr:hypothetical protein [Pectobacterium aroidearum]WKA60583.1 hypothetical protein QX495_11175 [Pectobacterium aroidearum]
MNTRNLARAYQGIFGAKKAKARSSSLLGSDESVTVTPVLVRQA